MDTLTAIRQQRAVRAYADQPITDDQLTTILNAGRLAGSAKNRQPWQFVVVRDPATRAALAECGNFTAHLPYAPVVIVVVMPGDSYWTGVDAGRAAQNMMLAATSLGLGTCIATLGNVARARAILGLPADRNPALSFGLGVPAEANPTADERAFMQAVLPQQGRLSLADLVHYERWGQRAPTGPS
jgi:nitroreductase